uniref:phytanoyl-CoA dioxygenase n=1 Tax=Strigamia maritima TaxID=126957 RepID=T1JAU1_STRMM
MTPFRVFPLLFCVLVINIHISVSAANLRSQCVDSCGPGHPACAEKTRCVYYECSYKCLAVPEQDPRCPPSDSYALDLMGGETKITPSPRTNSIGITFEEMRKYGSILDQTLRRKRDLKRRKQTVIWAAVNFLVLALIYYDMSLEYMSDLLLEVVQMPRKWTHYAELTLICIFGTNMLIELLTYAKLSYLYDNVVLNQRQKQLLAVMDESPGFTMASTPYHIPELRTDLSPNFMTTSLMSSSLFNLSSSSRCSSDLSASSPSWQYYRNYPSMSSPVQSPQIQLNGSYESPELSEYNRRIRLKKSASSSQNDVFEENSITDEASLLKYLNDYDQSPETSKFETRESPEAMSGSFWNLGHSLMDFSSQLRKYTYQLATRLPQTSISHANSDPDFPTHMSGDDIWFRLGVTQRDLYTWTKNLRQWVSQTILGRIVSEITTINDALHRMGSTDLQIGEVSLATLRQVFLTKSHLIPSLSVLLPYLELTPNQEYLVHRIKELARGGCMSEFVWNGGGEFKGRPWSDHLPTDSAIVIHLFCTYLDSRLPPHPNYPDGKTFASQCLVRSPDKPVLNQLSLYIYQTRLVPPHFKLVVGDEVWDLPKINQWNFIFQGRNNLFHTILLFLYQIKIREKGMLGRVNLGLSGRHNVVSMTRKCWLLFLVSFICGGRADRYNITRHYQGDIYTQVEGTCTRDFCHGNGNQATSIPWAKCQCQCLPTSSVFRQDTGKCVGTISECGEHMAVFVSPAFTESVPLVSLPENDALLYPTAEISLTDPSFAAVGSNLCVLTYLKVLGENGWEQLEQLNAQTSPTFKAVGESGKLFLQFSGDAAIRRRLSAGLVMVDVTCERETTASVIPANVQSKYCIIFRLDTYTNLVKFERVTYVGAMLIYLLVRRQRRNRLSRKCFQVPCEEGNDNNAFKESQYEFVMDSNEETEKTSAQLVEAVNSSNDTIDSLQSVRVECVPQSGLQFEAKVGNDVDNSRIDFIQLKRRLLFDPSLLDPDLLESPPPAAAEFLTRVREMIGVAKSRIKSGKFLPSLGAISEELQELNDTNCNTRQINEAFGLQVDIAIKVDDTEFGLADNDDRFTFLARIPEDRLLTDSYDGLYDFESFRQEMVKKMQKKRREQMQAADQVVCEEPDYDDWMNDDDLNIQPENSADLMEKKRCSRALILKRIENGCEAEAIYDVPNSSETRPVATYLFGDKRSNVSNVTNVKVKHKITNCEADPTEDSGYHSGDSESTNNKLMNKCASGLKSLRTILSVNKSMKQPNELRAGSSDEVQHVTIGQWLNGGEGDDQLIIDYDRINCSNVNFSETDFSTADFMSTLESSINLDDEIDSSSSDYSDSLEGTPVLRPFSTLVAVYSCFICIETLKIVSIPENSIKFKYTLDNQILSTQQRHFFEENGYLVIKKLIPDELIDGYCKRFIEICNTRGQNPMMTVQKDLGLKDSNLPPEDIIYKLQDFFLDENLFHYCRLPTILNYVKCFTGPNIMAVHCMLINKPPDSGSLSSRHPLHQDLSYFPFRPADRIVATWTAMEKVTRENGCLVVIPGSHKGELLRHGYPNWPGGVNKMYYGIQDFSQDLPRIHLEMEKGDTVFFHPILIHGSGTNRTKGYRKAISCHYAASECHYIDVKGTIQEELGTEILEVAKKKGMELDDFALVWKLKSHLVHGERINI